MAFKVVDSLRTIEFGTPGPFRDQLNDLVLKGLKKATAGLESEYEKEDEPIEHVGEQLVLLGNGDVNLGKIEITRIVRCAFKEVTDEFALAEGEGDLSGDDFRASHKRYWTRQGYEINDETRVVLLFFQLCK